VEAGIVAIGSELLGSDRVDTNSLELTRSLRAFGFELRFKSVVGDSIDDIAAELLRLAGRVDLVVVTGGLGPTSDDVTREAIARAFDKELVLHEQIVGDMERRFAKAALKMPEVNRRQALVPEDARWIHNERGTAPGLQLEHGDCTLFFFPGVPHELEGMIASSLRPWLEARGGNTGVEERRLKVACLAESRVEEMIAPAYAEFGRERITVLAKPGEIEIRASVVGRPVERTEELRRMHARLSSLLGQAVFSADGSQSLEAVVGDLLVAASATVSTAESCTGGLVAERLTRVSGSSAYFAGGAVTYADRLKREILGVAAASIEQHGSVSEVVALEMAVGAIERFGTDYALALTGVAGPDGGSEEKPVGTVHIALCGPGGTTAHYKGRFPGPRERVRQMASQWALDLLRKSLRSALCECETGTS